MTTKFLFLGVLLAGLTAHAGGVYIGNGGDSVLCEKGGGKFPEGYYALDYMMTLKADNSDDVASVKSWEESRDRILNLLANGYPSLHASFEQFLADLDNSDDWTRKHIWLAAPHGLLDLKDEQIRRKLPENCGVSKDPESVSVIQTVVRNKQSQLIRYEYDDKTLSRLQANPLQYSFLMVHEWLWSHADDPQIIRWANQFLHSKKAGALNPADFRLSLKRIGVSSGSPGFVSVCDRSPGIVKYLTDNIHKSCGTIVQEDLDRIFRMDTSDSELTNDDLSGLSQLSNFNLSDSSIKSLPEDLFEQNSKLVSVLFNNLPQLTEIPEGLFAGGPTINTLTFINTNWQPTNLNLFAPLKYLAYLRLEGLQVSNMPEDFLTALPIGINTISLQGPFTNFPTGFFTHFHGRSGVRFTIISPNYTNAIYTQMIQEGAAAGYKVNSN